MSTSVRDRIKKKFSLEKNTVVQIPHISISYPVIEQVEKDPLFRQIIVETLTCGNNEGEHPCDSVWLDTVPSSLRDDEAKVINYLGMVAAIDFRHWGEKIVPPETTLASEGEVVKGLTQFYCVASKLSASVADKQHAVANTSTKSSNVKEEGVLLRGSAAMMYLLRRAVEEWGIHWYDIDYLSAIKSEEEALEKLSKCFLGCEIDRQTPMWMPATQERVSLLLSLATSMKERQTDFYKLLLECEGRLFSSIEDPGTGPKGYIDSLRELHSRFQDVGALTVEGEKEAYPILKLSQLTAMGIASALKALWSRNRSKKSAPSSWLERRREIMIEGDNSTVKERFLFVDELMISLCCDYQIPKGLRACRIFQYDSALGDKIDRNVLLVPGSEEEVSLRVGTLIAGEMVLNFIDENVERLCSMLELSLPCVPLSSCDLDYALWYVGRQITTSNHHLCRTIMY